MKRTQKAKGNVRIQTRSWLISIGIMLGFGLLYNFLPKRLLFGALLFVMLGVVLYTAIAIGRARNAKPLTSWLTVLLVGFGVSVFLIYGMFDYSYEDGGEGWLMLASLIVAVPLGIGITFKWLREKIGIKALVGRCFFSVLILFLLLMPISFHMNYVLDVSEPQEYQAEIMKKDIDTGGRRGRTKYKLILEVDGESIDLVVPSAEYFTYEVGDTYVFQKHHGAFGVPFYLADGG